MKADKELLEMIGKTVADVETEFDRFSVESIVIKFTDGSRLRIGASEWIADLDWLP